ncbi:MAG: hypothetical protein KDC83_07120 [Flavobacteriales bacterium]|nr:hypothetical protein [Flavobacteriales bacterium]
MQHLIFTLFLGISCLGMSATKTANSGNWNTAGTWSPSGIPQDGDEIIINGNVSIAQNDIINLTNVRITINGSLLVNKKGELNLDANSTLIVSSSTGVSFTHGNSYVRLAPSVTFHGSGDNFVGPQSCNHQGCTNSVTPLPVELVSFIAQMMEDRAHLEWKTASEINNDYFVIERLDDNNFWLAIGEVHGNGTTNEMHFYTYDDYEVDPYSDAYYRLKQVDFDGNFETFDIKKSEALKTQGHAYRVIRTLNRIEIQFEDDHIESTEISLIDANGMVLKKEVFGQAFKGQKVSFDLVEYPAGWYVVGISGKDNMHFEKMIRVK